MGKIDKLLQLRTNIVILFFLVLLSFQVSLNFIYLNLLEINFNYRLFKNKKVNEVIYQTFVPVFNKNQPI